VKIETECENIGIPWNGIFDNYFPWKIVENKWNIKYRKVALAQPSQPNNVSNFLTNKQFAPL
jgi:hypothetical protein